MPEILMLAMALVAGALLGLIHFAGLSWTVRRGLASTRPALWFMGSLMLRTALALVGFYLVSSGRWERLLACLVGFIAARFAVGLATAGNGRTSHDLPRKADDALES